MSKENERSGAVNGYPFSYHLLMTCKIGETDYEFSQDFCSPTQHSVGDVIHVGEFEGVKVSVVEWYINKPGHAFMELEDLRCTGAPGDYVWLLEYFDHSSPYLGG
jgi:hypothetical protein